MKAISILSVKYCTDLKRYIHECFDVNMGHIMENFFVSTLGGNGGCVKYCYLYKRKLKLLENNFNLFRRCKGDSYLYYSAMKNDCAKC